MIGGKVVGVSRGENGTLLTVEDGSDQCAVRVEERRIDNGAVIVILVGDSVWWQCGEVMWTPRNVRHTDDPQGCAKRWDIRLPKIGYSHAFTHV